MKIGNAGMFCGRNPLVVMGGGGGGGVAIRPFIGGAWVVVKSCGEGGFGWRNVVVVWAWLCT